MLKRVCVILHVKVFFLSACSVAGYSVSSCIKVAQEMGSQGRIPRTDRKMPKVIPTPVIIRLHISSLLALPSCLKDAV